MSGIPEAKIEPIREGRRRVVARARLFESLSAAVASHRLSLLAAPPGAGKTTLLSSWIESGAAPRCTAWVAIDEQDNCAERFWQAIVAALDRAGACDASALSKALAKCSFAAALDELFTFLGETLKDEIVVLVLDDFQEVSDARVLDGVAQLLKLAPPNMRLVISSRRDPALPLHRLRLSGQLAEVRAAPLAFTPEEARQLFAGHGLLLSSADVDSLVVRTEGWAGALALAALALRETDDPSRIIRDFAGDDRVVADYLASEVLGALPADLCEFLVRTAVADELCGDLVDALLDQDGGSEILEELERRNCFVIGLGRRRQWYRYHRLFLELLRSRLAARPRREREELHSRAARWHADNDHPVEAIRHAISAQEWRFAADLAGERWLDVVLAGRGASLRPLLSRLPDELVEREPAIAVAFAAIHLESGGRPERADAYLELGRAALARGPADPAVAELHAVVSLQRARSRGDLTLAAHSADTLGGVQFAEGPGGRCEHRALVLVMLGACEALRTGHGAEASRHLRAGIALARRSEQDYLLVGGLAHLAALSVSEGRLHAGADLALEAIHLAEAHEWLGLPLSAPALLALGWAEYLWCDSASVETLGRAADAARASSDLPVRLQIAALTALTQLESGDGAQRALETLRGPLDETGAWEPPGVLDQVLRSAEARVLLAAGECDEACAVIAGLPDCARRASIEARAALVHADPATALALLDPHLGAGPAETDLATRIEVLVLAAVAHHAQLAHDSAHASLERALELAGAGRFPRVFLGAGSPLRDLLTRQVRRGTGHRGLVEELQVMLDRRSAGSAAARATPLLEPLSKRELTVLGCLETMLSTEEIAAELFLSTNTVKTHTKSIYRKLGVTRRRHAVSQARALGMI
ncbi:MAG TPA: LuxR C-terminal-related transcriptional regulator [Gaiellales bacterium]|nr:LuxR C-terminal-related transcriptional regulator [Gaiellales bacterium]